MVHKAVEMIGDLITGREKSKIVLIEDCSDNPGRGLCTAFLVALTARVDFVHYFQFDFRASEVKTFAQKLGLKNVKFHDGTSDLLEWKKTPCSVNTNLVKYLQDHGGCHKTQTVAIVIDSMSNHLLHRPTPYTCQTLHSLSDPQKLGCDVKQVVCLVHHDLHNSSSLSLVEHVSSTVLHLKPSVSPETPFRCHTLHKKPTGKIIKITEGFNITPEFSLTHIQEVKVNTSATDMEDSQIDPTANLTFNLTLSEKEKEARSNVVLPYMQTQEKSQKGDTESKIFYQPDEADDFDEEDPDDDLDI